MRFIKNNFAVFIIVVCILCCSSLEVYAQNGKIPEFDAIRGQMSYIKDKNSQEYINLKQKLNRIVSQQKIPYDNQARYYDALRLIQEQKYNAAIYELNCLIEANYNVSKCYELLGDICVNSKQPVKKTVQYYKNALKYNPNSVSVLHKLSKIYLSENKNILGMEYLSALVQKTDDHSILNDMESVITNSANPINKYEVNNFYEILAAIQMKLGKKDDAYKNYVKALQANPDDIFLKYHLVNLLYEDNCPTDVVKIVDIILQQKHDDYQLRTTKAKAYAMNGDINSAYKEYVDILRENPDSNQAKYGIYKLLKGKLPLGAILGKINFDKPAYSATKVECIKFAKFLETFNDAEGASLYRKLAFQMQEEERKQIEFQQEQERLRQEKIALEKKRQEEEKLALEKKRQEQERLRQEKLALEKKRQEEERLRLRELELKKQEELKLKKQREYEALQAKLKAQKEAQEAKLKAQKEAQEAKLKAQKEAQEAKLKAQKEAQERKKQQAIEKQEALKAQAKRQAELKAQQEKIRQEKLAQEKQRQEEERQRQIELQKQKEQQLKEQKEKEAKRLAELKAQQEQARKEKEQREYEIRKAAQELKAFQTKNPSNYTKYNNTLTGYLNTEPKDASIYLAIANTYKLMEAPTSAIKYYKEAIKLSPNDSDLYYSMALSYMELNSFETAYLNIGKSIKLDPNNTKAKNLLPFIKQKLTTKYINEAYAKFEKNNYLDASVVLDEAIKKIPDSGQLYYYRALSYDAMNRNAAAIMDLQKAVSLDPSLYMAFYQLGKSYEKIKDERNALVAYERFLSTEPDEKDLIDEVQKKVVLLGQKYY